ncbi:MAG TPA: diguanylate cyclase, partial [Burkholderiales bacterium]|nr:diguanylate cyclase [Burkholderiales bacterium]
MEARKKPEKPLDPDEKLRLWEERFQALTELASEWYWEQDENCRFTLMTGSTLGHGGIDTKNFLGTHRWDRDAVPVGDGGSWDKHKAALKARQPFTDFLFKRPGSQGEVRYISTSGQPVFDDKGRFRGYRGIAKDITETKRAEELQSLEHSVAQWIAEAESVAAAMTAVIRAICETEGWECGRYFRPDQEAGVLRFGESWGVPEPAIQQFIERSRGITYKPGVGLMGRVWQSGQPLWVADVTQDARAIRSAFTDDIGIRGGFVFPVISEAKTIGVLAFNSREARKADERLLKAILAIGGQIGQFLERKRAEEEQRRFRAAMDASADLMLLIDRASMRYIDVNDAACRALGYTREELLAMGPQDIFSKSREELAQLYDRMFASELTAPMVEGVYRCKDGSQLPIEAYPRAVRSAAGDIVVSIARDIRERKRAEQLRELEHAVTSRIANADSTSAALKAVIRAVCETEGWACGRYLRVDEKAGVLRFGEAWSAQNPAIERFIAESREVSYAPGVGLAGGVWQSGQPLWVPDTSKDTRTMRKNLAREAGLYGAIFFPVLSEGKTIGVLTFNSREVREPEKTLLQALGVIGNQIGQFVQRKQAEEAVRESETYYRALTELSADWYWEQDAQFRFTDLSGHMGEKKQFPRELWLGKTRWELPYVGVSEDDWRAHKAALEAHRPFRDFVVASRRKNGSLQHISTSGYPIFDSAGKFNGYRGIARDVSERRRSEELLRLEHTVTRALAEADSVGTSLKAAIRAVCETEGWECGRYLRVDEKAGVLRSGEVWSVPDARIERYLEESRAVVYGLGVGLVGLVWQSGQPLWVPDTSKDTRTMRKNLAREIGLHGAIFFPVASEGKAIGVLAFNSREVREPDERLLQAVRMIGSQIGQFVQRKQAEEVLRESEERFRSLTQLSSDMYWEQDDQFRFTSMSGTGSQRVNLKTFPTIGKKRWEQNYTNMTADAWAEHIATLEAHKPFREMELCRPDESGKKVWISIAGEPVFDSSGAFKGYRGVGKDISERKQDEERIQFLANHDALTSLPNRAMFSEVLNLAIQNARRYNRNFAVLFIDLDRFKNINDTLGHEAGDRLLQEMGARLTQTVRASDVVARLGGDEFVVLVQEVSEARQVEAVARKILSALVQPMVTQGQECRVTASIGICMFPAEAQDEHALMKNADIAMYRAKEDGKNNYKFYSEEMNVHSFERLALETSLRRGLERSEFVLHYQAKLDLHTERITGVEALVRWQHPDLGMVPPAQF